MENQLLTNRKKALRQQIREILLRQDKDYLKSASKQIAERVLLSDRFKNAQRIFIYCNTETEPETSGIISKAFFIGKTVSVPKCISSGIMHSVIIRNNTPMTFGTFGVPEPYANSPQIPQEQIDLCVIPCLAADIHGNRLGHGGGYYDVFLQNTKAYKLCLCFEAQLLDTVPVGKYDIPMDCIITENRTICFR